MMASNSRSDIDSDDEDQEDEDNELLPESKASRSDPVTPRTAETIVSSSSKEEAEEGPNASSRKMEESPFFPQSGASAISQQQQQNQSQSTNRNLPMKQTSSAPLLNVDLNLNNNQADDKTVAIVEDPLQSPTGESEDTSPESTASFSNECGIGRYRPPCLQKFANKAWMLFWMCWFCLVQGMLVNGLVPSVLSTIERRFDFTTSTLGRIMQFYDIGYVICCIPVSYFGGRHSKPFFIGLGLLIMGCGSFLFSMPHIVSEAYTTKVEARVRSHCFPPVPLSIQKTNLSSSTVPLPFSSGGVTSTDAQTMCPDQILPKVSDKFRYAFLFCFAHFLHGVGATPLFTLGVSYIDENVKPTLSSMYIGIFYAFAIFGPAIGFLLSGTFLRFHTDFLQAERQRKITEIDETDPHWVGAWWIGFQVASILSVLAVFPILSFPKVLPGAEKWFKARSKADETKVAVEEKGPSPRQNAVESHVPLKKVFSEPPEAAATKKDETAGGAGDEKRRRTKSAGAELVGWKEQKDSMIRRFFGDVRHIPAAVSRLFFNPTYMLVNLAAAVDGLLITGLSSFMTKYLERQFNLPSSKSSMLLGCIMVPVAGLGTMASGYVVKRYRLTCQNTLKFCIVMVVFCLVLTPMFLVYCDHSPLVGLETSYPGQRKGKGNVSSESLRLMSQCNEHCKCDRREYRPICAEIKDKSPLSFYSPCFAGCSEVYEPSRKLYSNCTCAPKATVKKGLCEAKCSGLIGFLILFAPMVLCTFSIGVPALSVVLRCVDYNERSFALGLQWVLIRCIGTIPAPVLFAWLFDISCVRPITESDYADAKCYALAQSQQGTCFVYDNKLLADLFLAFGLVGQTGTLLFFVLALVFYRRRPGREDPIEAELHSA